MEKFKRFPTVRDVKRQLKIVPIANRDAAILAILPGNDGYDYPEDVKIDKFLEFLVARNVSEANANAFANKIRNRKILSIAEMKTLFEFCADTETRGANRRFSEPNVFARFTVPESVYRKAEKIAAEQKTRVQTILARALIEYFRDVPEDDERE